MQDAVLSTTMLRRGWMDFMAIRLRLADCEVEHLLVDHPSGSTVLPYDPERRVALIARQSRDALLYLGAATIPEGLSGVTDPGEQPDETARREALEEAGVALRAVEFVARVWMTPASSTEHVHLYLAEYRPTDLVAPGGGDAAEQEVIDVTEEPLALLWAEATSGQMQDAKLLTLLQALKLRRPDLFA